MLSRSIIIRTSEPYQYKYDSSFKSDLSTLAADIVFDGFICNDDMTDPRKSIFDWDMVSDINSPCFVRETEMGPGRIIYRWREPNKEESLIIVEITKNLLNNSKSPPIKESIIFEEVYKWCISHYRDIQINTLL